MSSLIYRNDIADRLLGCIYQDPTLLSNVKYPLNKEEFEPCLLHKILFISMYNLVENGYKTISRLDLESYLEAYPPQYEMYNASRGGEYLDTISSITDIENYPSYWNEFVKISCINKYNEIGFDINMFWDVEKSQLTNIENLNNYTLEDIINHYEKQQTDVRKTFFPNAVREEYKAGTDFLEYKEIFKTEPLIGNSFQSSLLNGIYRGMYGFIIRVAKSGGGKSILSMGDLLKATATEYYDINKGMFVKNKSRKGPGAFINTELEIREEIDPMIIAWISAVPRGHIINGQYEEGEEERVEYASKVLDDSNLYIIDDPEFTTKSIVNAIRDYAFNYGVKTVAFDYIQNNGYVAKELSGETKVPQREDMVLLALTDRLKQVQRECGISLISSVQTNGQEDNMEFPTEAVLAGGKSQVRKTDGTMVMLPPTKKELQQLEMAITKWNMDNNKCAFGNRIEPNNVIHIIKGRTTIYPKNTKVFQHVDLSTGRSFDMFCTDKYNNPMKVDELIIEYED